MTVPASSYGYAEPECRTAAALLARAASAGLAAGLSVAVYQYLLVLVLHDMPVPARLVAAMLLGQDALQRWYSPLTIAVVGLGIHALLSLSFGIAFGALLIRRAEWRASARRLIAAGAFYGAALWWVNFYLIAPLFDWLWFPLRTTPLLQGLIGHAVFFGAVLGGIMAYRCRPPGRA